MKRRSAINTGGRSKAGFTLAELLIVLLLMAIFTGIALTEMRGSFDDALLRSSARDLMSGLGLASSRAVALNLPHAFLFDREKNEFSVQPKAKSPGANREGESRLEEQSEIRKIDERITIEIRDPTQVPDSEAGELADEQPPKQLERDVIHFFPDGTADRREIVLRDRNQAELLLRINPVTGRVRLEETE
jgi:prepilin-type N-terminal cleavage/methylation domain-containing protein